MEIDFKNINVFDFTKENENARRTEITIIYEGKNITKEIHSQLTSCSQSDSINQLDTLELTLENRDMLWISSWMPQKGETLKATLTLKHWEKDLEIITHDMGLFFIDTVDFSGPPDVVNIKAISFDIASDIVDKKENKVWENVTYKTIFNEIAKKRNIKAICEISFNRKYQRIEQKLQSDFDFLKKLSEEAGINLKLFDNKIIAFEEEEYEKKEAKKIFFKNQLESYSFSTEDTDSYSSCTISYYNYKKKKKIEKTFKIKNRNSYKKQTKRNLFINEDKQVTGKNVQEVEKQLLEIAKKALRDKNKREIKGNISFMGTSELISVGDTIILNDFGNFSGKYMIDDLKIDFLSYKINAEIHKIIEFEVEND